MVKVEHVHLLLSLNMLMFKRKWLNLVKVEQVQLWLNLVILMFKLKRNVHVLLGRIKRKEED